jgi:hypothetical protein
MKLSPITLFVYKRPCHTRQTVGALQRNDLAAESDLFIYSDGPKSDADREAVTEVREYVKSIEGFKRVSVIERQRNLGLAQSIIAGVTEIVGKYGRIIVLEDDLLTSPYFLNYMNTALNLYEKDDRIMQISGNMFNVNFRESVPESFFLPYTTTWGWGTWLRAWKNLDETLEGYEILKGNNDLRYRFDMHNTYPYFKMLEDQRQRKIDSWGIQWYLSIFLNNGIVLSPRRSLTIHFGFDSEATHAKSGSDLCAETFSERSVSFFPEKAEIDKEALEYYIDFFKKRMGRGLLFRKIINTFKRVLTK